MEVNVESNHAVVPVVESSQIGEARRVAARLAMASDFSETQAGKGSLPYSHPQNLGAVGATGTLSANRIARDADLIIGIGLNP